jgi:uncharacterized membrane-anchored protein
MKRNAQGWNWRKTNKSRKWLKTKKIAIKWLRTKFDNENDQQNQTTRNEIKNKIQLKTINVNKTIKIKIKRIK